MLVFSGPTFVHQDCQLQIDHAMSTIENPYHPPAQVTAAAESEVLERKPTHWNLSFVLGLVCLAIHVAVVSVFWADHVRTFRLSLVAYSLLENAFCGMLLINLLGVALAMLELARGACNRLGATLGLALNAAPLALCVIAYLNILWQHQQPL